MRTTIKLALLCFMSSHCSSAEKTLNDSGMNTDADEDGYTLGDGDCNDNDPSIHPGAIEQCDDVDRDCDGLARNNVIVDYEASRVSIWGGRLSVYDGTLTSKINSSLLGLSFPGREGTSNWEPVSYTSRWIGYDRSGEDFANHAGGQVLYVEEDSNSDGRVDENSLASVKTIAADIRGSSRRLTATSRRALAFTVTIFIIEVIRFRYRTLAGLIAQIWLSNWGSL